MPYSDSTVPALRTDGKHGRSSSSGLPTLTERKCLSRNQTRQASKFPFNDDLQVHLPGFKPGERLQVEKWLQTSRRVTFGLEG